MKYNLVMRSSAEQPPEFMVKNFERICRGNKYVTTLHCLNSSIVKLSKLTKVGNVYRGIAQGGLPARFWSPNSDGVCGGVEPGFMSTTTDAAVAFQYAAGGSGGIVFEMRMGMVDRGADLSWLSQYPHEKEILFAPLTGIERRATRVDGSTVVVELRLAVNLTAPTIEQVVAKLQRSHLSLIGLLTDGLRAAAAPERALKAMHASQQLAASLEPQVFNEPDRYLEATNHAFAMHRYALASMTKEAVWDAEEEEQAERKGGGSGGSGSGVQPLTLARRRSVGYSSDVVDRMRSCALLCARSGAHFSAAQLLLLASERTITPPAQEQARLVEEALDKAGYAADAADAAATEPRAIARRRLTAALSVIDEGLQPPWPPVLVALCDPDLRDGGDEDSALSVAMCELLRAQPDCAERERARIGVGAAVLQYHEGDKLWLEAHVEEVITSHDAAATRKEKEGEPKIVELKLKPRGEAAEISSRAPKVAETSWRLVRLPAESGAGALLLAAASAGATDLLRALLSWVSVRVCDAEVNTPLHRAAAAGKLDACRLLLSKGANERLPNKGFHRPVDVSRRSHHVVVSRLFSPTVSDGDFKEAEAEVEAEAAAVEEGKEGGRRVHALAWAGDAAKLTEALSASDAAAEAVNAAWLDGGLTPLMLACRRGHAAAVKVLLDKGARLDATSKSGCTPLALAAEAGAADVVATLLDKGASTEAADNKQHTPLMNASDMGHIEVVELLLAAKASVEARNKTAMTALMFASQSGNLDCARALVVAGAQLNVQKEDGFTPFFFAVQNAHAKLAEWLLGEGADINCQNKKRNTPLMRAAEHGSSEIDDAVLRLLIDRARRSENALELELKNEKGRTAVHAACTGSATVALLRLLAARANPNVADENGMTPLHIASQVGDARLVRVLCSNGADPNAATSEGGHTPLMEACKLQRAAAVEQLLIGGADRMCKATDGKDATALAQGHPAILELLKDPPLTRRGSGKGGKAAGDSACL